jgi:hypothetical protein
MDLLLEYADTLGLGSALDLELISNDAKNPYHFMKHSVPEIVVNKSKSAG